MEVVVHWYRKRLLDLGESAVVVPYEYPRPGYETITTKPNRSAGLCHMTGQAQLQVADLSAWHCVDRCYLLHLADEAGIQTNDQRIRLVRHQNLKLNLSHSKSLNECWKLLRTHQNVRPYTENNFFLYQECGRTFEFNHVKI